MQFFVFYCKVGVGCHFPNWMWQQQQPNPCVRMHKWWMGLENKKSSYGFFKSHFQILWFLLWAQEAPRQEKSRQQKHSWLSLLTLLFNNMMKMEKKKQVRGKAERSLPWETVIDFYESCFYKMWKRFISWTAWFPHLHYPWISAQASFSLWSCINEVIVKQESSTAFLPNEKGTFPWAKICPLARLLKSHQVKTHPLSILTVAVKINGI